MTYVGIIPFYLLHCEIKEGLLGDLWITDF